VQRTLPSPTGFACAQELSTVCMQCANPDRTVCPCSATMFAIFVLRASAQTDEFVAYPFALKRFGVPDSKHRTVAHKAKQYVDGDIHTNTVESAFSLLKRGIMGTWHRISAKHLAAYLDEMTWRFNNRKNPYLFRDTMLKLIHSENLEYKELTRSAA
jgi:ISXO2-like transposase domain